METEIKSRSFKVRAIILSAKLTALTATMIGLGQATNIGLAYARDAINDAQLWVEAQLTPKTVTTVVDPNDASMDDLIEAAARRRGISPALARAIAQVESAGGRYVYRFEPALYEAMKGLRVSDSERRALASSHGVMHVLGRNAQRCGLQWSQLYIPRLGIDCGIKILSDCLSRTKTVDRALICYNGSPEYPDKVKIALANAVIEGEVQ